jgi:hypothetical protein
MIGKGTNKIDHLMLLSFNAEKFVIVKSVQSPYFYHQDILVGPMARNLQVRDRLKKTVRPE